MYIGGFAGIIFSVSSQQVLTFKNLTRKLQHKFHTHEILNGAAKLESLGVQPISISLEIQLLKQLGANVGETLKTLREACSQGLADYLIICNENIGLFVIETLEEGDYFWDGKGEVFMATAKLTLKQYNVVGDF